MTSRSFLLAVAFTWCWASAPQVSAAAQRYERVDDAGTVVSAPLVPMRWRPLERGRGVLSEMTGELDVALRLNLSPWMGREVRLYLVLEPAVISGAGIAANWRASGLFLPGSVQSGARTLVYHGRVTDPFMYEKLRLTLTADGSRLSAVQPLQFYIEAEAR